MSGKWQKNCIGYDSNIIFEKAKESAIAVKEGKASYERDTCLFYDKAKYIELLYAIERVIKHDGECDVLDVGGGLASMYFQHKSIFGSRPIRWNVVEQEQYVEFGKNVLEEENLKFHYRISDVERYNFVIFGSSLQYIDSYNLMLEEVLSKKPYIIFVDRTPMSCESWIAIETVHEPIYEASYPLMVFDRERFDSNIIENGYELLTEWHPSTGGVFRSRDKKVIFESMLYEKI